MDKEYISVSAFSKRHNINKRKVYELIQQEENKRYVLEKDGVKYIYAAMPLEAAQKTNKSTEEEPRQEQEVQDMPREVPQEVQLHFRKDLLRWRRSRKLCHNLQMSQNKKGNICQGVM